MFPNLFGKIGAIAKGVAYQFTPGGKTYATAQREEEERRRRAAEAAAQRQAQAQQRAQQQAAMRQRSAASAPKPEQRVRIAQPQKPVDKRSNIAKVWDTVNILDKGKSLTTPQPSKAAAAKPNPLAQAIGATGRTLKSMAQETVKIAPTVGVSLAERGRENANNATSKTFRELQKLSYEERKRAIMQGPNSEGLRIMLKNRGFNINDPSDQEIMRAMGAPKPKTPTYTPGSRIEKALMGSGEVQSYQQRAQGNREALQKGESVLNLVPGGETIGKKLPGPLAGAAGLVTAGLDLMPSGGSKNKVVKEITKTAEKEAVRQILEREGVRVASDQGEKLLQDLALTKSKQEAKRLLDDALSRARPDEGVRVAAEQAPRAADNFRRQAEELAARAVENDKQFQPSMQQLASDLGLEYKAGPPKSADRIAQKTARENAGDFSKIRDSVRGTMSVPNPDDIDSHIQEISKRYQVERVKNGFLNGGAPGGYKDIKVNVRLPDGSIGEVIMTTPEMLRAKTVLGGHKLYKAARVEEDAVKLAELEAQMKKLYSEAEDASRSRLSASSAVNSVPSTNALAGANGIPEGSIVPEVTPPAVSNLTMTPSTSKNLGVSISDTMGRNAENVKLQEAAVAADKGIPVQVPTAERGFVETVRQSDNTAPEVAQNLQPAQYDVLGNKDTLAKADEAINKDFEGAITRAKTSEQYTTEQQAQSLRLIDELQATGRHQDAIDIVEKTAERATKAGQASQILAAYNRLTPEGILLAAQRQIENAKRLNPEKYKNLVLDQQQAANLRTMAEKVRAMAPGEAKDAAQRELINELGRVVPTPAMRKFTTLWKAGLLTGVKGAVGGNSIGNTAAAIMRKIADVPAAGIDAAISTITGNRSKTFTLSGLVSGFGEGVKTGFKNFKAGVGAEEVGNKLDYNKVQFGKGALGRAAQKYTDSVFNFYSAADRPFFHSALKNNLYDLAKTDAINQGLRGKEAKAFIEQMIKEPTDEILTAAHEAAQEAVFQKKNALGAALSGAKKGLSSKGGAAGELAGEVVLPFTGVPAAIASAVYTYSPAGATVSLYKALRAARTGAFDKAAQRALSEGLGRGLTGTGVMWLGAQLHNSGQMTLGWPTDPQERALWESEGKTPYSILIGGKWRSLNYTGPVMSLLAIGGQIDNSDEGGLADVAKGVASSGKAIIGSTPLQGVQSSLDAVTDPERYGDKYIQNTISSAIPTLIKDIANAADPYQREVNSVTDAIQNKIPGLKNNLPIKADVFGNDMQRPNSAVGSIIDPFKSSEAKSTPLTQELRRLFELDKGTSPSKINNKVTFDGVDTELTAEQKATLQRGTGQLIQDTWSKMIADPSYQSLSDDEKVAALNRAKDDIAAAMRARLAAKEGLGQYAPGFAGKATKVTSKQEAILKDQMDYTDYLTGSTKIASGVSGTTRDILTKVEAMNTDKRKEYLRDGKNRYDYELAKFENDSRGNKLTAVERYEKLLDLGKLKITTKYSADARDLYGLSKRQLADYTANNAVPQTVLDEVMAMDQELAANGFISKAKFGGGSGGGGGGGGKTLKVPKPKFGSFSKVDVPVSPTPNLNQVLADYKARIGNIKVLENLLPPESVSNVKIAV